VSLACVKFGGRRVCTRHDISILHACMHALDDARSILAKKTSLTANASHACACVTQSELTPANTPNGTRPASDSRRTDNVKHRHDDHCSCPRGGHADRRCGSAVRLHREQGPQRWIRGRRVRRWEVRQRTRSPFSLSYFRNLVHDFPCFGFIYATQAHVDMDGRMLSIGTIVEAA